VGTIQQYWDSVTGIVKEGGYSSLRLGNFSNGLQYRCSWRAVGWNGGEQRRNRCATPPPPPSSPLPIPFPACSDQDIANIMSYDHPEVVYSPCLPKYFVASCIHIHSRFHSGLFVFMTATIGGCGRLKVPIT
jgi:hypothetical protein